MLYLWFFLPTVLYAWRTYMPRAPKPERTALIHLRVDENLEVLYGTHDLEQMPPVLKFDFDISSGCLEAGENKLYTIGENWTGGDCLYFECKMAQFTKLRSKKIAVAVQSKCAIESRDPTDPYCVQLPTTKDAYPQCCPMDICIKGNEIKINITSPSGEVYNLHKIATMADIEKLQRAARSDLYNHLLEISGYNRRNVIAQSASED